MNELEGYLRDHPEKFRVELQYMTQSNPEKWVSVGVRNPELVLQVNTAVSTKNMVFDAMPETLMVSVKTLLWYEGRIVAWAVQSAHAFLEGQHPEIREFTEIAKIV